MANVFISHRGSDTQQAEQLANEIRSVGHQVWLDVWNIDLGDSIVERINEGLEGATYVVVCYSSSGITSPWMSREWMSTLARQLSGHGVKILPVLLTGGDPPAILADLKYADLVSDWSQGVSELLRAMR
ncbi:MAG: toll/interleukin-1 receptor domain-containing protein [Gemmatimonadota bacterium]|nr:MAG: toll/interleukin-1 receptor domain-containing protein [Gemmatimonadota bacterium]